jgi:hypothetical protein
MTTTDFEIDNHGSICILRPLTEAAKEWCDEHLPEGAMWWGGGCAVEPRYIDDIVDGILNDGLSV